MSWMQKLCETYENCAGEVGRIDAPDEKGRTAMPLLPLCHTTQNAQIEITIDSDGEWVSDGVFFVSKADSLTIIPCTEESANRTSGLSPHPLFDKLQYLAGDYAAFGGKKQSGYVLYIEALAKWCASEFALPALRAVFAYLQKGRLIADLVAERVLPLAANGKLMEKWEGEGEAPSIFGVIADPSDAFVRFRVRDPQKGDDALFCDEEVRKAYIDYQTSLVRQMDLCMVRGEWMPRAAFSPAKLRSTGDRAKLISANDSDGFTYRGRFTAKEQAFSVGFETTSKAHNALKWLISRRGWKNGDQVVLTWGTRNEETPPVSERLSGIEMMFAPPAEANAGTNRIYAGQVRLALGGYYAGLTEDSSVAVMALDSTSGMQGRLSIPYYREMGGGELLDRLAAWNGSCRWYLPASEADGRGEFVGSPALREIAEAAYGAEAGEKLVKKAVERLLPCILDERPLPRDIVARAAGAASRPQSAEPQRWRRTLAVACALVRKARNDACHKEAYSMALDLKQTDRSYLFGRLLACAEQAETLALLSDAGKNGGEDGGGRAKIRQTNAVRFMQAFSVRPLSIWRYLEEQLNRAYYSKLRDNGSYFAGLITEIIGLFEPGDAEAGTEPGFSNRRLDDTYLLGYHLQLAALRRPREKTAKSAEAPENTAAAGTADGQ